MTEIYEAKYTRTLIITPESLGALESTLEKSGYEHTILPMPQNGFMAASPHSMWIKYPIHETHSQVSQIVHYNVSLASITNVHMEITTITNDVATFQSPSWKQIKQQAETELSDFLKPE